jgi:hypothetical protein
MDESGLVQPYQQINNVALLAGGAGATGAIKFLYLPTKV